MTPTRNGFFSSVPEHPQSLSKTMHIKRFLFAVLFAFTLNAASPVVRFNTLTTNANAMNYVLASTSGYATNSFLWESILGVSYTNTGILRLAGGNAVAFNPESYLGAGYTGGHVFPAIYNTNVVAQLWPASPPLAEWIVTVTNLVGMIRPTEYDNGNSGTTKTIDWSNGVRQKVTLTGNCTFTVTGAPLNTSVLQLKLVQDTTGSRTIAVTGAKWANAVVPVPTSSTGAVDIVTFYYDGTSYYGNMTKNYQ